MLKELFHKAINTLHHKLNPLHVYCRLVNINIMNKRKAKILSKIYDKLIYKLFYPHERRRHE